MKKVYLFMLMAVGLLISGNVGAQNVAKIVETNTEYATFAEALSAVKANQTIKLLADANAGSGPYITINKAMTLDLDTYTLTIDKTTYYGLYVYANLTIQAAYNSTTGHYGSIYNAKSSASQAALIISDASCTVTVNSGYLHSNGASAVIMQDDDYGAGSLILSANAELHSDGSNYDIEMNGKSSFVTVNGTHDGLRVLVSNFTDGSKITNNGTLTNMKLVENKTNMVYEGSGTYEFTLGSKVSQNTMTALGANATIAEGYVTSLSSGYYTVVEPSFSVNGVGYGDLQSAMHVSTEEHPVVVLKDVNIDPYPYGLHEGGYLDLNGKTLTVSSWGIDLNNSDYVFMDNSAEHTGKIVNTSGEYTLTVNPGVNLTLLGGTYQRKNNSDKAVIYYYGSSPESVTIDGENTHIIADYGHGVSMPGRVAGFEITVRNGATITAKGFCIANLGTYTAMNTTMNIESGAQLTSTGAAAIYHPGGGYLNISGDNTLIQGAETGVEIRAGELNMIGGTVACTGSTISCNPNGSGTTTKGAGISVAQHTTKQPVIVNISGGTVSGPFALIQVNPQNNTETDYLGMKVNVTGGKFVTTKTASGTLFEDVTDYGTVTYDANAMLLSQNRRILVSGGYYKTYDPAPFVMPGYVSVTLASLNPKTAEDEQAITEGYVYKVVKITEAGKTDESEANGDWHNNANTVWNSGEEPNSLTKVTISGQEIIVSTPATAYGIEISGTEQGNTKLTITETGRLMVDMGGITGTTPITFDVQNGGQMAIAPSATPETEFQPEATVTLVADWAHRKATADTKEQGSLVAEDLYWQHIATPLSDGVAPTPSETGVSYVNNWNLVNGWTSATWANVITPFVGYQISSIKSSGDEKIALTFKGKLVGNHVDPMTFTRIGFSFFGNSYLAPIDIRELLTCLETKGAVDPTVLLYNSESGYYNSINRASYYIPEMIAEIQPMQSFFVFSESATNVDFDYTKAVWNSFCAKAATPAMAPATAPAMQENPFSAIACIDIKAANGAADRVMLFEGDEMSDAEDKGYDAHKMMTSGVNIYAKGSYANLAILATNNLLNSQLVLKTDANTNYTMSFANIKGEYALYDALTGRTINMVEGTTYDFEAQSNATITDRFFVVEAAKAPTTMENVDAQAGSCKFMKNGIMFIERNNKVYNAQGQIVK